MNDRAIEAGSAAPQRTQHLERLIGKGAHRAGIYAETLLERPSGHSDPQFKATAGERVKARRLGRQAKRMPGWKEQNAGAQAEGCLGCQSCEPLEWRRHTERVGLPDPNGVKTSRFSRFDDYQVPPKLIRQRAETRAGVEPNSKFHGASVSGAMPLDFAI